MEQYKYETASGDFDYDRYKSVQIAGNHRKLTFQWVDEKTIAYLSRYILSRTSLPSFGICHGSRRGAEQAWFSKHLNGCHVIGTEISDTAAQFANTVQWDFHEPRAEWVGAADFVYSNSWDHAYDPRRAFSAWLQQLNEGGLLILEHTPGHVKATELDPFGATLEELCQIVKDLVPSAFGTIEVLTDAPGTLANGKLAMAAQYVVVRRAREP